MHLKARNLISETNNDAHDCHEYTIIHVVVYSLIHGCSAWIRGNFSELNRLHSFRILSNMQVIERKNTHLLYCKCLQLRLKAWLMRERVTRSRHEHECHMKSYTHRLHDTIWRKVRGGRASFLFMQVRWHIVQVYFHLLVVCDRNHVVCYVRVLRGENHYNMFPYE